MKLLCCIKKDPYFYYLRETQAFQRLHTYRHVMTCQAFRVWICNFKSTNRNISIYFSSLQIKSFKPSIFKCFQSYCEKRNFQKGKFNIPLKLPKCLPCYLLHSKAQDCIVRNSAQCRNYFKPCTILEKHLKHLIIRRMTIKVKEKIERCFSVK